MANSTEQNDGSRKQQQEALIEERRDYSAAQLRGDSLQHDPIEQFTSWLQDARDAKLIDATAMTLCTVDNDAQPHSRVVLLKKFDTSGFTWFSNYDSAKGQQIQGNAKAALQFYWRELERQVRIEGTVTLLPLSDADEYFYSRPEGSRFSAAASKQSQPVENRQVLEDEVFRLRGLYPDGDVKRPNNWGGFLLKAHYFEFWQGRSDRLHDRFVYTTAEDNRWQTQRLAP